MAVVRGDRAHGIGGVGIDPPELPVRIEAGERLAPD
jgi:hypothetical protein